MAVQPALPVAHGGIGSGAVLAEQQTACRAQHAPHLRQRGHRVRDGAQRVTLSTLVSGSGTAYADRPSQSRTSPEADTRGAASARISAEGSSAHSLLT